MRRHKISIDKVQETYNFPCRALGNIAKVIDSKLKKENGIRAGEPAFFYGVKNAF